MLSGDCGVRKRPKLGRPLRRASEHDRPLSLRIPPSAFGIGLFLSLAAAPLASQAPRPRARDVGIVVGVLPPGPLDAITDVEGVRVGHATVIRGDSINTGVTAILPHAGNVFREKVPAAVVVGNGFGKLAGSTQVNELGELESPIVLTCTLCVPRAADAVLTYLLGLPGNGDVRSANPVVAETNDGFLNDIRARAITPEDVLAAIRTAAPGAVGGRAGGAGPGTVGVGSKGGIGAGECVFAFSTRRWRAVEGGAGRSRLIDTLPVVTNAAVSPLFEAVVEATEEAISNSLLRAETVRGYRGTVRALPLDSTLAVLKRFGVIRP